jgi:D-alanyl-D-alanine carboxypeptidase
VPGLAEAFERIGTYLEHRLPLTHAAGAALAVTDMDEVLGVVVRGFADAASGSAVRPGTRFQIGSISKSFAGVVAIQEAEAGTLDIHEPVDRILPGLHLPQPFGPITTHHLMSHTSGLGTGTEDAPTGAGAAWLLGQVPPTFAPGSRFWYSNDGWKLVGMVLEKVTGTPFHDLVRERVIGPLGMRSTDSAITNDTRTDLATGYQTIYDDRPPRLDHPLVPARWLVSDTADGSIVSNVIDMSVYVRALLGGGRTLVDGHDIRLLSPDGFRLLTTPVIQDGDHPSHAYAYGLRIGSGGNDKEIAHSGGMVGYTALMVVRPDQGIGCVMLLNGDGNSEEVVRFALDSVDAALRGDDPPLGPHAAAPTVVADASDYLGSYEGQNRNIDIVATADGMMLRQGPMGAPLVRAEGDSFLVEHAALDRYLLRFGRDGQGRVVEAFHGDDWLRSKDYGDSGPRDFPQEWLAYVGLYRSNNPWAPALRVLLRKGELAIWWSWATEEELLLALGEGRFAVGQEWRPMRIRFLGMTEGRALAAEFNGARWYRACE